jgi:hypothetical protein
VTTDSGALYAGSGSGFAIVGSGDFATINCTPLPGFGTNSCQDSFSSTYASAHADNRATLNVSRNFTGSGQAQSLALDAGLFVTVAKTNFLTSSTAGDLLGAADERKIKGITRELIDVSPSHNKAHFEPYSNRLMCRPKTKRDLHT